MSEAQARAEDRERWQTPGDAPLALALGRLHDNKAFDVLIAALAGAPGLHLWLAGTGPSEAALRKQADRLGLARRVRFLGWVEDPAPLYAAADMVVVPSRIEPLGNVVIEAWAQSLPVVASRSAGPRQLIEDRVSGLLCDIENADGLARALGELIANAPLRAGLAAAGRAAYEQSFTETAVVRQYLDFFASVSGRA